jgi:hypothetical protein
MIVVPVDLACAWRDMHSLFGSNVKRSKSAGPLPR